MEACSHGTEKRGKTMQRKVLVPTLNKEAKKKCDSIGKEKRGEILEQIYAIEEKYLNQLEKIHILKAYFNVELNPDDPHGIKDKGKKKKREERIPYGRTNASKNDL